MPKPTKVVFLDSDLACLFGDIEETWRTAVQCAIFVQSVDRLIRKQKRKNKSILISISELQHECFPFWSYSATKRILQRLRRIGVLRTQIVYMRTEDNRYVDHKTRIWVRDKKILELAKQVKQERDLQDMAKKLNTEKGGA